jgi:hypothetical protein
MNENSRVVRCQELLEADVDGEVIGLHIERGQCYGLNEVASEIWRMLASPVSVEEICQQLTAEYEVDGSTCRSEVLTLLTQLEQERLVREV